MSCMLNHLIPRLTVLVGLTVEQVEMAVANARRQPAAPLPDVDPAVADAVWQQWPSHDAQAVTTVLRQLLAGLFILQRQEMVDQPSVDTLIAALLPPALAG